MPAYNALGTLPWVLAPLISLGPQWEIIVVDDCSQDDTLLRLRNTYSWVRALPMPRQGGQAIARNAGAAAAQGEILVFIDSDVVAQPETLRAMVAFLQGRPDLDGVFGCYSAWGYSGEPPLSRFRNLQHRLVHQKHRGLAHSFWTGLGAMRRETFFESGGFDPVFTGIEDVELGKRVIDQGGRIWLEPSFEGRHLKQWSLRSMVKTDIFVRAIPWTYFGFLGRTPRKGLNLSPSESLPAILLLLTVLVAPFSMALAKGLFACYLLANLSRYRYFRAAAGLGVGLSSVGYLMVHHMCCIVGGVMGGLKFVHHHLTKEAGGIGQLPSRHQSQEAQSLLPRDSRRSLA